MTERSDTWTVVTNDEDGGIDDLHSGAEGIARDGTPYAEW
jgi:general secretion pathway protein G